MGNIYGYAWDYSRPKFKVIEVIERQGMAKDPARKDAKYATLWVIYLVEIIWEEIGMQERRKMPFNPHLTHEEAVEDAVLSSVQYHEWIEEHGFVIDLFGDKYATTLLKNEGTDFIKYLASRNQLLAQHACAMLRLIENVRTQQERSELEMFVIQLLESVPSSGKVNEQMMDVILNAVLICLCAGVNPRARC